MTFFWILWGFDALVSLIVVYFFFVGLSDGSVSSRNMGMWLLLLLGVAVLMGGTLLLRQTNFTWLAKLILAIVALPAFGYGLIVFITVVTKTRWN